jgi:hypothetical protein
MMRKTLLVLLTMVMAASCSAGKVSSPADASTPALSLNKYNEFVEIQRVNVENLRRIRQAFVEDRANPQELFALSLFTRTIEAHMAAAMDLADLALLSGTREYRGSPYVPGRMREHHERLQADLRQLEIENLFLNKSQFKSVSKLYGGYLVDLRQLLEVLESDIATLETQGE